MGDTEQEGEELEIPSAWKAAQIIGLEPLVKPEGFISSESGTLAHGVFAIEVNGHTIELEQSTHIGQTAAEEMIKRLLAANPGAQVIFT